MSASLLLQTCNKLLAENAALKDQLEKAQKIINAARELAETAQVFWNSNIHAVEVRPKAIALILAIEDMEAGK